MSKYLSEYTGAQIEAAIKAYQEAAAAGKGYSKNDYTDADKSKLTALQQTSNRNLLDNAWFTVNQRGQSSYSGSGYGLDRWWQQNSTNIDIYDGYIKRSGSWTIEQRFEPPLPAGTYTFSTYVRNAVSNGDSSFTIWLYRNDRTGIKGKGFYIDDYSDSEWKLLTHTFTVDEPIYTLALFGGSNNGGYSIEIKNGVKLELGTMSTLALDTAPNYAEELAKCQRFLRTISGRFRMIRYSSEYMYFSVNFDDMRSTPSVVIDTTDQNTWSGINIATTTTALQTGFTFGVAGNEGSKNAVTIYGQKASHGMTDGYLYIPPNYPLLLSKEL